MPSHRVEDAVRLDAFSVADEHAQRAPIAQLADDIQLLDVRKVVEHVEVQDRWCGARLHTKSSPPSSWLATG
jgi:hypothetical protein